MATNKTEIRVYGIRRSGNHAIISWIFQHYQNTVVHLNDVRKHHIDPYQAFSQVSLKGMNFWKCKPRLSSYMKHKFQKRSLMEFTIVDPAINVEYIRAYEPKDCLIVSYEDYPLNESNLHRYDDDHDEYVGTSDRILNVVILRDAHNLCASLIKAGFMTDRNHAKFTKLFKSYSRIHLGQEPKSSLPLVCINYNQWCIDREYRINVAEQIGFQTTGDPFLKVSHKGGGSSFDKLAASQQPEKLKNTLHRWKALEDNPLYSAIFQDKELIDLSSQVFGSMEQSA